MSVQSKPRWLLNTKYIIWDLDGTLYPNQPDLKQAINRKVFELIAEARNISLKAAQDYHRETYSQLHSNTQTLLEAGVNADDVRSGRWFSDIQINKINKTPSLVQAMRKLDQYQHLVNTNSTQASAESKLKKIGFTLDDFKAVVGNMDTVGINKPKLKPFRYMLTLTNGKPNQHVFVGDRYETDLAPAKKVGMRTVLVYDKDERADLSFGCTQDLVKFLQ